MHLKSLLMCTDPMEVHQAWVSVGFKGCCEMTGQRPSNCAQLNAIQAAVYRQE